jgi:serine/threonine-protein kinase
MQHKNAGDPRSLGRDLGVQVVVEGTMRTSADAIRVSARVLSVEDGFQIWAKRFDGARSDVLRIGDEASREVAAALSSRAPTRAAIATDPGAIDLYLRGRHEYFKFWATSNERAIELLRAAHERAPSDALILAAYAEALARQFGVGSANPVDRSAMARRLAEEAIRLAPQLADAHCALAQAKLHEPDLPGTAAGVVRALSLSPLLPDAHHLRARLLAEVGTPQEAMEAAQRAMQLEPRYGPQLRFDVQARARAMLGEWNLEDYGGPPEDLEIANLYWIMATRFTMWKRDAALSAKLGEMLMKLDAQSVLARAFVGWIFDRRLSQNDRANIDSRKSSTAITQRMRIFWNQLSAEVSVYTGETTAMNDVRAAVDLGLVDISWMDRCPMFDELRKAPEWAPLRETVATRARVVYMQLQGGSATIASSS